MTPTTIAVFLRAPRAPIAIGVALLGLGLGPVQAVHGQTEGSFAASNALDEPRGDPFALRISPRVWFMAPGGRLILPGEVDGGRDIDVEQLNLDSPRVSPYLEVEARFADRWSATLSGFAFSIENETSSPVSRTVGDVKIATGDPLSSELRFEGGDLTLGYAIIDEEYGRGNPDATPVSLVVDLFVGARLHHVDAEVTNLSPALPAASAMRASADELFVEPIIGVVANVDLAEQFSLQVGGSVGGFSDGSNHQSVSWDIRTGAAWTPTPNIDARIGFRILTFDLDSGSGASTFEYRGSLSGLFAGVDFRF